MASIGLFCPCLGHTRVGLQDRNVIVEAYEAGVIRRRSGGLERPAHERYRHARTVQKIAHVSTQSARKSPSQGLSRIKRASFTRCIICCAATVTVASFIVARPAVLRPAQLQGAGRIYQSRQADRLQRQSDDALPDVQSSARCVVTSDENSALNFLHKIVPFAQGRTLQ